MLFHTKGSVCWYSYLENKAEGKAVLLCNLWRCCLLTCLSWGETDTNLQRSLRKPNNTRQNDRNTARPIDLCKSGSGLKKTRDIQKSFRPLLIIKHSRHEIKTDFVYLLINTCFRSHCKPFWSYFIVKHITFIIQSILSMLSMHCSVQFSVYCVVL